MCIYRHNQTIQRGRLWETITTAQLPDANWILGGDFNVVNRLEDRMGGLPTIGMRQMELLAWNNMLIHFRVADAFLLQDFRYTWDNGQLGTRRLASRIDRIYINQALQPMGGQSGIWPSY